MPAYFDTGYSVREPMWHGEGLVIGEYPTDWADARSKAGLMWEPEERPHFVARYLREFFTCRSCLAPIGDKHDLDCEVGAVAGRLKVELLDAAPEGSQLTANGEYVFVPDPGHKDIVRDDTFAVLGVATDEYSSITHGKREGGASMEQIVETFVGIDGVKFETGGSCRGGKFVWSLMYLDEPYFVPGDKSDHLPFLALLNSHDGAGACKLVETQVRVVCWNTVQMASAEGDRTGRQMIFRHTGNVEARIEEAKASITQLRSEASHYIELGETMMRIKADDKQLDQYLSEFLPSPAENGEVVSDTVLRNVDRARSTFKAMYETSATCADVNGTAYGLFQASTEYLDHVRAYRSQDSYLGRSILKAEPAKAKSLAIVGRIFESDLADVGTPWAKRLLDMGVQDDSLKKGWEPARQKRVLTTTV